MQDYTFQGQKDGEEVIFVAKQHPMVFMKPTIVSVIIIIVTIVLIKIALALFAVMGFTYIVGIIALVLLLNIITKNIFVWQNSVIILTSQRLLIADQNGWFNRTVSETNLENILTINHAIKGPIQTMFNFGDLNIRASGVGEDELVFYDVSDPYNLQQQIVKSQSLIHPATQRVQPQQIHESKEKTASRQFWNNK